MMEAETEAEAEAEADVESEHIITTTNRLFLSHINYKNYTSNDEMISNSNKGDNDHGHDHDNNNGTNSRRSYLSQEEVKTGLKELFSNYGTVQDIYLSDGKKLENKNNSQNNRKSSSTSTSPTHNLPPSPFGFLAMETTKEAQLAINNLITNNRKKLDDNAEDEIGKRTKLLRNLFRDLKPAKTYRSKNNTYNKKERKQKILWKEYRERISYIVRSPSTTTSDDDTTNSNNNNTANIICQVSTSHLERFKDYVLNNNSCTTDATSSDRTVVKIVGCVVIQKCTSLLLLRVDSNNNDNTSSVDSLERFSQRRVDYLEEFSQRLWDTWYIAPNLNRITILNEDGVYDKLIEGTIRKDVVPALFTTLLRIRLFQHGLLDDYVLYDDDDEDDVDRQLKNIRVRVAIFPPKLQNILLKELDEYNNNVTSSLFLNTDTGTSYVEFTPTHPTHTISIIQLHSGVDVVNNGDNDIDKEALYVLGRLETNPFINSNHAKKITKNRTVATTTTTVNSTKNNNKNNKEENNSISRAYWKLQEAWERYKFTPPCLDYDGFPNNNDTNNRRQLWALDCGAAPGGWTKFLFRPGVVERIYAIDPGKLSNEVLPGLDDKNGGEGDSNIIRYLATTIQKALPRLVTEFKDHNNNISNEQHGGEHTRGKYLDIWVSDMNVKDMSNQIDYFLLAREKGLIGTGTFFVLTIKCIVGYSTIAFDSQTQEQVQRLTTTSHADDTGVDGALARDVQVIHLFSNRTSERTIIGYLL